MKILLSEIRSRYVKEVAAAQENQMEISRMSACSAFRTRWATLIKQRPFTKMRDFNDNVFEKKIACYRVLSKMMKFKYDFQDEQLNTPLHLAA